MDFFNSNLKKQRESVPNQISNEVKNANHNLDIKVLINLREFQKPHHRIS